MHSPPFCRLILIISLVVLLPASAQGQTSDAEPPSQLPAPVCFEDCDFFGPPNITANPPKKGDNYYVRLKSFDMTSDARPLSFQLTYDIDKLLPSGGRAVIQFWPSQKKISSNEDLCGYARGGCPIHPGHFTVSFNLTIDSFTEIQFSMFTKAGELLSCVYFEES